jgi:phosphoserine phosphatase RsbU/P
MRSFILPLLLLAPLAALGQPIVTDSPQQCLWHAGDTPAWANPNFDDSAWLSAKDGAWPRPAFNSDGIVWVRIHLGALPTREPLNSDPLAPVVKYDARLLYSRQFAASEQIFADGSLVEQRGRFPPDAQAMLLHDTEILNLPLASNAAARNIVIALRFWYPPAARIDPGISRVTAEVAPSRLLRSQRRADRLSALLGWIPSLAANALLGMLGLGLLIFWYWSRRRELLWAALLLALYPLAQFSWALPDLLTFDLSFRTWRLLGQFTDVVTMITTVEFVWTIFALRARVLRGLAYASLILFNASAIVVATAAHASTAILWSHSVEVGAVEAFNLITLILELRVLVLGPRNRTIAAALAVIPIGSALSFLNLGISNVFGLPHVDLFEAGALLSGFVLALMLLAQAIRAWRDSNALRVEYEAAREIQQQLVVEIPQVRGFHIETSYKPAAHVGGDFYGFFPDSRGGLLIVIGDVSGKGLRAAMSVSAIMGALRTLPIASPAALLQQLNLGLAGRLAGGFATCCIGHAHPDGTLTLANAGHLAPYRNGEEIKLESGLPLGLTAEAGYSETTLPFHAGDKLTLLTDGVVEARAKSGELFGFERTRDISTESAENIARATSTFGQEDDITVLKITRLVP